MLLQRLVFCAFGNFGLKVEIVEEQTDGILWLHLQRPDMLFALMLAAVQ